MIAESIVTPLLYETALALAGGCGVSGVQAHRVARALMAVDVASRQQAVPDYARLTKQLEDAETAIRGAADVQERLALVDDLAEALDGFAEQGADLTHRICHRELCPVEKVRALPSSDTGSGPCGEGAPVSGMTRREYQTLLRRENRRENGPLYLFLAKAVGLALLLLAAVSCPAAEPEPVRSIALKLSGFAAADLLSTEHALIAHPGAYERNPLMRDREARIGGNAFAVYTSAWAINRLQKDGHPGWARVVKWGFIGTRVVVVANNEWIAWGAK